LKSSDHFFGTKLEANFFSEFLKGENFAKKKSFENFSHSFRVFFIEKISNFLFPKEILLWEKFLNGFEDAIFSRRWLKQRNEITYF